MTRPLRLMALLGSAAAVLLMASAANAAPRAPAATGVLSIGLGCAGAAEPGEAHCLGLIRAHRVDGRVAPTLTSGPVGYGPSALLSAYKLHGTNGHGRTVAIVDAYNDPAAAANLNVYRSTEKLPACTTGNHCFKKINEYGSTKSLPAGDYGWAEEESLDLDMVSAICPTCHILLVEAASAKTGDLGTAERTAARSAGVVAISNSWGAAEAKGQTAHDGAFDHPGIAITVSSGDSGYGVEWPASNPYVTAVGGTTLSTASNARGWTETAWSDAGSGCSAYEPKPSFQHNKGCARRTVADVAAVADPSTGVGVYDTYNSCGSSAACDIEIQLGLAQGLDGWAEVGGTSVASPIIASVYALAGNTRGIRNAAHIYAHTGDLYDVTSGSNSGNGCSPAYLCTARKGYDGPTGWGTPHGTAAF